MINSLKIDDIRNIFAGAKKNLDINKEYVDSLNVFPVPDGDTGTNMSLTMASALREVEQTEDDSVESVVKAFSRGALRGARGNSGVILSQIFKGFAEILSETKTVSTKAFAEALRQGSNVAYDVVSQPKEGTILTVIRLTAEYAVKISQKKSDFIEFLELILKKGGEVLDDTPNLLPVLKKAGVVDAGGKGLLIILQGMYNALVGIEMEAISVSEATVSPATAVQDEFQPDIHNLDEIEFAYCTEFFIINMHKTTTVSDIDKLKDRLLDVGDCVIVVGDLSLVKVHIHTNTPDKALKYALQLGELDKPKIENMLEQSRQFKAESKKLKNKNVGILTICVGEGLKNIFTELGVDKVLEGGQTMNPSVSDIVDAVDSIKADNVFILPNNSNIILAAEQAKELTKANLVVIATKSVPQGISAAINFNPDISIEENTREMQKAAESVKSGQVTTAVRDTEMDGLQLKSGDIIGIYDKISARGEVVEDVTLELVSQMADEDTSAISLYYGAGITEEDTASLEAKLSEIYKDQDIMIYSGGQNHYFYLVAVE